MFTQTINAKTLPFSVEAVVTTCFPDARETTSLSFTSEMEAEHWVDVYMAHNMCSCTIEFTHAELPF